VLNTVWSRNASGLIEATGIVENQAATSSRDTKVIAAFYDVSGDVLYAKSVMTGPTEIPAGARSEPFKFIVPSEDLSRRISRVTFMAEGEGYTSVPEMPWPAVVAVSTIAMIAQILRIDRRRSVQ
jgi:hypothetical protein